MKWGVIFGGISAERDVSLASGEFVCREVLALGESCVPVLLKEDAVGPIVESDADAFLLALHGGWGEDGRLQGLLDLLGRPYGGSGPLASALAMNKAAAKQMFRSSDIPTPLGVRVTHPREIEPVLERLPEMLVIKPTSEGSSIGVQLVDQNTAVDCARRALETFGDILIEEFVEGRFLTVTVLDSPRELRVLPPLEVISLAGPLYDRRSKTEGLRRYDTSPALATAVREEVEATALAAHQALGCGGVTRVDCILQIGALRPKVLEVNTIPGMGPSGNLLTTCAAAGVSPGQVVQVLMESATCKRTRF